ASIEQTLLRGAGDGLDPRRGGTTRREPRVADRGRRRQFLPIERSHTRKNQKATLPHGVVQEPSRGRICRPGHAALTAHRNRLSRDAARGDVGTELITATTAQRP